MQAVVLKNTQVQEVVEKGKGRAIRRRRGIGGLESCYGCVECGCFWGGVGRVGCLNVEQPIGKE